MHNSWDSLWKTPTMYSTCISQYMYVPTFMTAYTRIDYRSRLCRQLVILFSAFHLWERGFVSEACWLAVPVMCNLQSDYGCRYYLLWDLAGYIIQLPFGSLIRGHWLIDLIEKRRSLEYGYSWQTSWLLEFNRRSVPLILWTVPSV